MVLLAAGPGARLDEAASILDVDRVADAARRGDFQRAHFLCEQGASLADPGSKGFTAIHWAAIRGDWPQMLYLLERGAPVNAVGGDGGTCLHGAAHFDRADMVARLLDAGGDLGASNQWSRTPLHVAARRGCLEVARLLLDRGADLGATTREGWTPLHVAYRAGQPRMVELLLARGADSGPRDLEGQRPEESRYDRPAEVALDPDARDEYTGIYELGQGYTFEVRLVDGELQLKDFAPDRLYPTGGDAFHCRREPWRVAFQRDGSGEITAILVDFLRRQVRGTKREHPRYVGSDACRECHTSGDEDDPSITWLRSRHALAYWRLATDWAAVLASLRPHYRDVQDPRRDHRCLLCHVSGAQVPDAIHAPAFRPEEGVGCEACHGPGSLYVDPEIMADREAFLAAGGRIPDETTCRQCHRRADAFEFATEWPKVAHRWQRSEDRER